MRIKSFLFCFFLCGPLFSQDCLEEKLNLKIESSNPVEALNALSKILDCNFIFSPSMLKEGGIRPKNFTDEKARLILDYILESRDLEYSLESNQVTFYKAKKKQYSLYGYISEEESGESLLQATVFCKELGIGTVTNEFGYFILKLPEGKRTLRINYVGRKPLTQEINLISDRRFDQALYPQELIEDIIITPKDETSTLAIASNVKSTLIQDFANQAPDIGGENDIMRIVKSLPGIQSGAGGIGGYFVRGGSGSQNLILMDGAQVYYPSHALGFYSIFNSRAVNNIKVYKSGFPARYGGRISSVIDVRTNKGNSLKRESNLSFSPQSFQLSTEGPLSNKGSYFVSGRASLFSPSIKNVIRKTFYSENKAKLSLNYYDINAKVNYKIGNMDRLFLSFYKGGDRVKGESKLEEFNEDLEKENFVNWGNTIGTLRWNHLFNSYNFLNVSLSFNEYESQFAQLNEYGIEFAEEYGDFEYVEITSENIDLSLNADIEFRIGENHKIRVGTEIQAKEYNPIAKIENESSFETGPEQQLDIEDFEELADDNLIRTLESAAYIEGSWKISPNITFDPGLRLSSILIEDYSYLGFEPRMNLDISLSSKSNLTLSFAKMIQYSHLLTNSEYSFPRDLWIPSDAELPPELAWHYELSYLLNLNDKHHLQLSVYHKLMKNLFIIDNDNYFDLENGLDPGDITLGSGTSSGLECSYLIRNKNLTQLVGLGYSHSTRMFDEVNLSQKFPFQFDRKLEIKTSTLIQVSKHLNIGFNYYLGTGHPFLVSELNDLSINTIDFNEPGFKNSERTKLQHRFDLSFSTSFNTGLFNHSVKLSVFNLYNKQNPAFHYLLTDNGNESLNPGFSLPIIPSLRYSINF